MFLLSQVWKAGGARPRMTAAWPAVKSEVGFRFVMESFLAPRHSRFEQSLPILRLGVPAPVAKPVNQPARLAPDGTVKRRFPEVPGPSVGSQYGPAFSNHLSRPLGRRPNCVPLRRQKLQPSRQITPKSDRPNRCFPTDPRRVLSGSRLTSPFHHRVAGAIVYCQGENARSAKIVWWDVPGRPCPPAPADCIGPRPFDWTRAGGPPCYNDRQRGRQKCGTREKCAAVKCSRGFFWRPWAC